MPEPFDRRRLLLYGAYVSFGVAAIGGGLYGLGDYAVRKQLPGFYTKVVRVIDGDTVEAFDGKEKKTMYCIKVAGIVQDDDPIPPWEFRKH